MLTSMHEVTQLNTSLEPLLHAISGSLASAFALLLFYPLERARIEMQTMSSIPIHQYQQHHYQRLDDTEDSISPLPFFDNEDIVQNVTITTTATTKRKKSKTISLSPLLLDCLLRFQANGTLYRGAAPGVLALAASNFVFFYAHTAVKQYFLSPKASTIEPPSIAMSLLASSLAGIVNVLITNPLWVASIRIQAAESQSSSLIPEIRNIYKKEGLGSLFRGTWASLLLVSNPVIQFVAYEQVKAMQLSKNQGSRSMNQASPIEALLIGAIAKAVATVLTYPLQLAQVLLRVQKKDREFNESRSLSRSLAQLLPLSRSRSISIQPTVYTGTFDCFQKKYKGGGIKALYAGFDAKLIQTVVTAATTFLTYEQILRVVRAAYVAMLAQRRRGGGHEKLM